MRLALVIGTLWPLALAAGLLVALAAGVDVTDGIAYGAMYASALGVPAAGAALYRWLPSGWPEGCRFVVGGMLALPLCAAGALLALVLLIAGMVALGHVPA